MGSKITTIINWLDMLAEGSGRMVSWLVLLLVMLTLVVAVPRYLLSNEWFLGLQLFSLDWEAIRSVYSHNVNALSDSIQYVHAIIFMVGVSYALKCGDHVRIDIIYRNMRPRTRAWVNIIGTVLLFYPMFIFFLVMSWQYVINAWDVMESSSRPGGLPFIYILKTFLLIMPVMMILQGTAILLRNVQILRDDTSALASGDSN
jgi:TRAP-type mannitol/chloroaromatic compound transport system permease small subunit